jgi:6-phosphogluconolactonase
MVMRTFIGLALALAAVPLFAAEPAPSKYWVFIGTYTGKQSKGIYRCEFDAESGKLGKPELAAEVASPSFLAIHPNKIYLYAVGETGEGDKSGSVHAYTLDAKSGELKVINSTASHGAGPCHLVVDAAGKNVLVANYGSGSASMLPLAPNGGFTGNSATVQFTGKGVNPQRQEGPHAHSFNLDPANKIGVVADLGQDKVHVFKYDPDVHSLQPVGVFFKVADGAGPRHFAFHQTKPFAYVINEMNCTINALHYTPEGKFEIVQTISTLPGEFREGYSTAEVQVHPSGKFVYGSNRGQNSIAGFRVDQETGKLTLIGHQGAGIKTPRNFGIDPTGKWMIVGNQDGNSVIVYAINAENGELTPTGTTVEVGSPVCIKFVAKE